MACVPQLLSGPTHSRVHEGSAYHCEVGMAVQQVTDCAGCGSNEPVMMIARQRVKQ